MPWTPRSGKLSSWECLQQVRGSSTASRPDKRGGVLIQSPGSGCHRVSKPAAQRPWRPKLPPNGAGSAVASADSSCVVSLDLLVLSGPHLLLRLLSLHLCNEYPSLPKNKIKKKYCKEMLTRWAAVSQPDKRLETPSLQHKTNTKCTGRKLHEATLV